WSRSPGSQSVSSAQSLVLPDDLVRIADHHRLAALEQQHAITNALDRLEVVANEDDRLPLAPDPFERFEALLLEGLVANGKHLVEEKDVEVDLDRDRICKSNLHAG